MVTPEQRNKLVDELFSGRTNCEVWVFNISVRRPCSNCNRRWPSRFPDAAPSCEVCQGALQRTLRLLPAHGLGEFSIATQRGAAARPNSQFERRNNGGYGWHASTTFYSPLFTVQGNDGLRWPLFVSETQMSAHLTGWHQ
jgi:hypothetical protein